MAKKPQSGTDEEEIIRRRDGVADSASDEQPDALTRRVLSDSRLRALAFALGSKSPHEKADQIDDTELLAYLLDTLPEYRRGELEAKLRGNHRAFGQLMTLRAAFSSPTDQRDRGRADDPARKIGRRTAGRVDIRRMGAILQFRNATQPRPFFDDASRAVLHVSPPRAYRDDRLRRMQRPMKRPPLRWGQKTEVMLRISLERVRRDFDAGTSLVEETLLLLDRWWNIRRHEGSDPREVGTPPDGETEHVRARLAELLRELNIIADRINYEFDDIASGTAGMFPPDWSDEPLVARYTEPPPPAHIEDRLYAEDIEQAPLVPGPDPWSDTFDVEAGPWTLQLASDTAGSTPQLAVSLRANDAAVPSANPFLTLVRPNLGFDTVNLDASGSGSIALPVGQSVLLLQGDEVWEVRLSFHD